MTQDSESKDLVTFSPIGLCTLQIRDEEPEEEPLYSELRRSLRSKADSIDRVPFSTQSSGEATLPDCSAKVLQLCRHGRGDPRD